MARSTRILREFPVYSAPGGDYFSRQVTTLVMTRARFLVLPAVLACGAPAVRPSASEQAPAPSVALAPPGQLSRFAGVKVMVLPSQSVQFDERPDWRSTSTPDKALLAALDSAVETALSQRGLQATWVFPAALQRSARRNPTYLTDPYALQVLAPVRLALRKPQDPLAEPFASQLRALAGVNDARYALIPLVLRFQAADGAGNARGRLHAVLIDSRGAQVVWNGEVASAPQREYSPSLLASLLASVAEHVADLVVPR